MTAGLRYRAGFRHLTRHPWQLALTVLGVGLGVSVTVALDLAIQSSREAFEVSRETVSGRSTHQILGGVTGIPDGLPSRLTREAGLAAVAPVVEGYAVHPDHPERLLRLLGVDPFSEAPFRPYLAGGPGAGVDGSRLLLERGGVVLSRETAETLGVGEGDLFPVRVGAGLDVLRVIGVLETSDDWSRRALLDLLVVDIAEAQVLLGRVGSLDRIDLLLSQEGEAEALARVATVLPPGTTIEPTGDRTRTMQEMLRAFHLNLTALSLLGLVFGAFLIYNTMTFSVVQRRPLFGTLRALGATRGELLRGVLAEAAVLGALGTGLGLLLGIVLGQGLVRLVTRTINDLYFVLSVEGLAIPPGVLVRGALLGIGVTMLATLPPAWEATTVSAREALTRSMVESRVRVLLPRVAITGILLFLAGGGLLLGTERSILAAFAGLFAIVLGMALCVPIGVVVSAALLRPVLRATLGVIGGMAARGVVTSLSRTAPAMASLVVAVSVAVGLGVMIQSFRGSVVQWLDITLQADLYVSPPPLVSARAEGSLPGGFEARVREIPGVAGVSTYRATELDGEYGRMRLVALDLDPLGRDAFEFLSGDRESALRRFTSGEGVLISEPFAYRHGLEVEDGVRLPVQSGDGVFPVLAVFRDYGSELGTVMLARSAYDRSWSDPELTSLAVFLDPGRDPSLAAEDVRRAAGPEAPVLVRENRELRALSLEVFDRTFEITRVLRVLAFLVAFIAVLTALMALQLERTRELGVLRANGMTPGQGWGLVTVQTGVMGVVAGFLALPIGLVLAFVMIHVVNRRSFGWTLEMQVGFPLLAQAVFLALGGALLAGVYPSWRMSRTSPSEALADR